MKKLGYLSLLFLAGCAAAPLDSAPVEVSAAPLDADQLIAFHEARVKRDPQGAIGWSMLAEAYVDKSRARDDDDAALKAESAARKSLEVRKTNNCRAALSLTHSLLEQHRFTDALEASKLAMSLEGGNEAAGRQHSEILLELGKYTEFEAAIKKLDLSDPSGLVVLARWHEVKGDNDKAVHLYRNAAMGSEKAAHSAPDATAWFFTKLAEAEFRVGRIEDARRSLAKALELDPSSYKASAAMTRLEAGVGNWKSVIEWGERTAKTARMSDIQGLVADAHLKLGEKKQAEKLYRVIEAENATSDMLAMKPNGKHSHAKSTKRHTHDRLFSLFLADRSRHTFLAHHAAEEDLDNRKDIYAWDTFAWGTYQYYMNVPASETGEGDFLLHESRLAIDKALAMGTIDARMLFHAGMIYRKIDPARAKSLLTEALAINPHFNALQAQEAKEALARLTP